jgi:hypothetical protein
MEYHVLNGPYDGCTLALERPKYSVYLPVPPAVKTGDSTPFLTAVAPSNAIYRLRRGVYRWLPASELGL